MQRDKGEQPSLSRGGRWEDPHPMTDRGAFHSKTPKGCCVLLQTWWALGWTCSAAFFPHSQVSFVIERLLVLIPAQALIGPAPAKERRNLTIGESKNDFP